MNLGQFKDHVCYLCLLVLCGNSLVSYVCLIFSYTPTRMLSIVLNCGLFSTNHQANSYCLLEDNKHC